MKPRFGKSKYKQEVIEREDVMKFKKSIKSKYKYKSPQIKKAIRLILEKYRDMAASNSHGVILSSGMGTVTVKYMNKSKQDRSKKMEDGDSPEYLNFGTNGLTAKIVWSIESATKNDDMIRLMRFDPHTTLNDKTRDEIRNNPNKYKKIGWSQK